MKKFLTTFIAALAVVALATTALAEEKNWAPVKPKFPKAGDFLTLTADLHQHTVFSDGCVWPTTRVEEAQREGVDVIALTDHIEYTPNKDIVLPVLSRPYEIALPEAKKRDVILIPGLEITRGTYMSTEDPIKHIVALFLKDFDALRTEKMKDAVYAAADQGAFLFWAHPQWGQPSKKSEWFPEMDEFLDKGILKGFEVLNEDDYQPVVIDWCQKHKVAMMGNTDIHAVAAYILDWTKGEHRPMTLIFAKERTLDSVKEALFAGRTAVYRFQFDGPDQVIGNEELLRPMLQNGLSVQPNIKVGQPIVGTPMQVTLKNNFPFELQLKRTDYRWIDVPETLAILRRVKGYGDLPNPQTTVSEPLARQGLTLQPSKGYPFSPEG